MQLPGPGARWRAGTRLHAHGQGLGETPPPAPDGGKQTLIPPAQCQGLLCGGRGEPVGPCALLVGRLGAGWDKDSLAAWSETPWALVGWRGAGGWRALGSAGAVGPLSGQVQPMLGLWFQDQEHRGAGGDRGDELWLRPRPAPHYPAPPVSEGLSGAGEIFPRG